jgi:hypothetical protein
VKTIYYFNTLSVPFRNVTIGIVSFLLINGLLTACGTEKKAVVVVPNVAITKLPGYMVKDTNFSRHDFNVWLVTTETSFDSLFTPAITSTYKPNFDKEMALAIKVQTKTTSYKVKFKQMVLRGPVLSVYFNVKKEAPDEEEAGWVSITAFPKNQSVTRVKFYYDNVMIRSIPVVVVY